MSVIDLSATQLRDLLSEKSEHVTLLDVRESWEYDVAKIDGAISMPMQIVLYKINTLEQDETIVCICHHGIRSKNVAKHLDYSGFQKVYNLEGGIDSWSLLVDSSVDRY